MEWLYKARIERAKDLFELSTKEIEIKNKKVAELREEINEKVEDFTKEIANLSSKVESLKKKDGENAWASLSEMLSEKVSTLTKDVSSIESTVNELGKAQSEVSKAICQSRDTNTPWFDSTKSGSRGARSGYGVGRLGQGGYVFFLGAMITRLGCHQSIYVTGVK